MSNSTTLTQHTHSRHLVGIISSLKQHLSEIGIKSRAIFTDSVLNLLCEAERPEQLEPSIIIPKVRAILESNSPNSIRRVRIYSRILQPQQNLLWFEDLNHNTQNQLLWSEEMVLRNPSFVKQLRGILQERKSDLQTWQISRQNSQNFVQNNQPFNRGLVAGMVASLVALILGFVVYQWLSSQTTTPAQTPSTPVVTPSPVSENPPSDAEIFAQAVRLAQEAVADGETAQMAEEWSEIAEKWQKAAELMEAVSPEFSRYATAQNRAALYRRNQEVAAEEALQLSN